MNLDEVKTIIQGKGLIIVVKRDNKTSNRKKVFNTLTKCNEFQVNKYKKNQTYMHHGQTPES